MYAYVCAPAHESLHTPPITHYTDYTLPPLDNSHHPRAYYRANMAGELLATPEPQSTNTRRSRYLSDTEKAFVLALTDDGCTQVEIAQRLHCSQSSVSDWLAKCRDTTKTADRYLRGRALSMAENVAMKGRPDVQLKALQGLGVAADNEQGRGISIIVGGQASVQVNVGIIGEKP